MTYTHKVTPYQHQVDAFELSWSRDQFALLMEMGTGKTKVAIDTIGRLALGGQISGALILAPKGVYMNWVNKEIPEHLTPDLVGITVTTSWRGGKSVGQKRDLENLITRKNRHGIKLDFLVMNIEALSSGERALRVAEAFLRSQPCMMIIDESTVIKNTKAGRTKAALYLGKLAKYRRIMTGMPVTRSPLDIFSQFEFLKPQLLGIKSYWSFRSRYAIVEKKYFGDRTVDVITGYQNVDDLQKRIAPHSFRVLKEDCLDLPPKVYLQRAVELTKEQERVYAEILENATTQLSNQAYVTATEVITQMLRLHQIVCGFVVDEQRVLHDLPENRTEALLSTLEEAEGSAIIWCSYRHNCAKVVEAISKSGLGSVVQYHGGTSDADRQSAVTKFQSGAAKYFVGTPATGGYGLTLTAASAVVYYSNTHNLELRAQSEDRPHRIGQTARCVTYTDLVADDTVDAKILKSLRNKIDIATAVTGDRYKEWLL